MMVLPACTVLCVMLLKIAWRVDWLSAENSTFPAVAFSAWHSTAWRGFFCDGLDGECIGVQCARF